MRSHLIGANLRRLHELVVDAQHSNAIFFTQGIGAVNDVLFHGIHIGIIGGDCGFWLRSGFNDSVLCRFFAGVRFSALHLHTAVLTIPINLETNSLADVPQLHIVVAVDDIGFHLHFFSIYDNAVGAALRHDPGSIRRGGDAHHQQAGKKTGCKTSSLHSVYLHIL